MWVIYLSLNGPLRNKMWILNQWHKMSICHWAPNHPSLYTSRGWKKISADIFHCNSYELEVSCSLPCVFDFSTLMFYCSIIIIIISWSSFVSGQKTFFLSWWDTTLIGKYCTMCMCTIVVVNNDLFQNKLYLKYVLLFTLSYSHNTINICITYNLPYLLTNLSVAPNGSSCPAIVELKWRQSKTK